MPIHPCLVVVVHGAEQFQHFLRICSPPFAIEVTITISRNPKPVEGNGLDRPLRPPQPVIVFHQRLPRRVETRRDATPTRSRQESPPTGQCPGCPCSRISSSTSSPRLLSLSFCDHGPDRAHAMTWSDLSGHDTSSDGGPSTIIVARVAHATLLVDVPAKGCVLMLRSCSQPRSSHGWPIDLQVLPTDSKQNLTII